MLEKLVADLQPDEEIVVADGGSKDGTPEYLQHLLETGQIQQFVSERDKGESHGLNKCMFLAQGEIIKCISDDDAFCYSAIRKAAVFMHEHPEVDVVLGYNVAAQIDDLSFVRVKEDPARDYQRWFETQEPFQMIGLPMLVRRSSLPLIGLFSTGVVMVDLEFIYRISSLKVNIAWCSAVLSAHVSHPEGNFNRMSQQSRDEEYNRIAAYYTNPKSRGLGTVIADTIEAVKRPIRPAKRALFDRLGLPQYQNPEQFSTDYVAIPGEDAHAAVYRAVTDFMEAFNSRRPVEFKYKTSAINKVMTP